MRRRPLRAICTARWPFKNVGKQKPRDPSLTDPATLTRRQGPAQPGRRRDGSIAEREWLYAAAESVSRLPPPQGSRGIGS